MNPKVIDLVRELAPPTQAQFDAYSLALDTLLEYLTASMRGYECRKDIQKGLLKLINSMDEVNRVAVKMQELPKDQVKNRAYVEPPREFEEPKVQQQLLDDLVGIGDYQTLSEWWANNRERIDKVQTPELRNPLMDAIRQKKSSLTPR